MTGVFHWLGQNEFMQPELDLASPLTLDWQPRAGEAVLADLVKLQTMVRAGLLGGREMPEDANPGLEISGADNYHYFTLTMALNYQRNSYALWRAATATFRDAATADVFDPVAVVSMSDEDLQAKLLKHKLALQRNKHPQIWKRLSGGIVTLLGGDVRTLFLMSSGDVGRILDFIQKAHKEHFPYLCGPKICHYWLYVMEQYTDASLSSRHLISVAPDTHVVQATCKLGLITPDVSESSRAQEAAVTAWESLLTGTGIQPIDVHTRLWLWSRAGFPKVIDASVAVI